MAGIGFELKKLFKRNSLLLSLSGYFYASFVTIGPIIVCVGFLLLLRYVLKSMGVLLMDQELLLTTIMYAFTFSLIISSFVTMILIRYLSDLIYDKKLDSVLPSLYGTLALGIFVGGIFGIAFLWFAKLPVIFEFLGYALYMELIAVFILMVFVSAIKDYKKIAFSFTLGLITGVLIGIIMIYIVRYEIITSLLFSMVAGFLVTVILIAGSIGKFFKKSDKTYFAFAEYFTKRPRLVFINVFYMISIFVHNIIIWHSEIGIKVADTFIAAPAYDVSSFFAMLTILPATVIFVVKMETTFYQRYKDYIHSLSGGGTLEDLNTSGEGMRKNMFSELTFILEVQFLITILCIILGNYLLPNLGFTQIEYGYFAYLCLGYFCIISIFIVVSLMLYFDDRSSALHIMSVFLVLHTGLVYGSTLIGPEVYGLGTLAAGFISMIFAIIKLRIMMRSLDYRLYCSQPVIAKDLKV